LIWDGRRETDEIAYWTEVHRRGAENAEEKKEVEKESRGEGEKRK